MPGPYVHFSTWTVPPSHPSYKGGKGQRGNIQVIRGIPRGNHFDQQYPAFLMGQLTQDMDVGTLLPGLSTLYKWSQSGTFGTCQ